MFDQNNEEKKLDWMYKNPTALVDREEYLLGRAVDKTLDALNAEEKLKQSNSIVLPQPKNHVEHECIPPSIRDFKLQQVVAEQVDLSAKLQEDPLVAIKKREEETRRQFLQNPVQLKKLQEALKAREMQLRTKKKKSKHSSKDLDRKIAKKLQLLKTGSGLSSLLSKKEKKKKKAEEDDALNTILMHKFNELKTKLTDDDLRDILSGNISGSSNDSSSSDEDEQKSKKKKIKKNKKHKKKADSTSESDSTEESEVDRKRKRRSRSRSLEKETRRKEQRRHKDKYDNEEKEKYRSRDHSRHDIKNDTRRNKYHDKSKSNRDINRNRRSESRSNTRYESRKDHKNKSNSTVEIKSKRGRSRSSDDYEMKKREKHQSYKESNRKNRSSSSESDSSDKNERLGSSDDERNERKKRNYGLVKADGSKIKLSEKLSSENKTAIQKSSKVPEKGVKLSEKPAKPVKLTEEEKERRRREMMENAVWRDKEREKNVRRYRESDALESKQEFNPDFLHKELQKSANTITVESRIKANINNIQRSKSDMNSHFSRRN